MKQLLTIILILISATCFSQTMKGDTLIVDYSKVKFIKVGENIYEVKSPTIEKVEKTGLTITGFGVSSGTLSYDSTTIASPFFKQYNKL